MFVEAYLTTWNATEAARIAGYKNPNKLGPRELVKVGIKAKIEERLKQAAMGSDEILARLTQQASANIYDFIKLDKDGQIASFNEDALRERGFLVRKLTTSWGKTVSLGIEMYDAHAALVDLGKHRGLFAERSLNVDLSQLTTEQLERIANGEDVVNVLAGPSES
jgi:hypothetical protein